MKVSLETVALLKAVRKIKNAKFYDDDYFKKRERLITAIEKRLKTVRDEDFLLLSALGKLVD